MDNRLRLARFCSKSLPHRKSGYGCQRQDHTCHCSFHKKSSGVCEMYTGILVSHAFLTQLRSSHYFAYSIGPCVTACLRTPPEKEKGGTEAASPSGLRPANCFPRRDACLRPPSGSQDRGIAIFSPTAPYFVLRSDACAPLSSSPWG